MAFTKPFKISADGDTPEGSSAILSIDLTADHNITGGGEFFTIVGQKPVLVINFSSSNETSDSISEWDHRVE